MFQTRPNSKYLFAYIIRSKSNPITHSNKRGPNHTPNEALPPPRPCYQPTLPSGPPCLSTFWVSPLSLQWKTNSALLLPSKTSSGKPYVSRAASATAAGNPWSRRHRPTIGRRWCGHRRKSGTSAATSSTGLAGTTNGGTPRWQTSATTLSATRSTSTKQTSTRPLSGTFHPACRYRRR